VTQPNPEAEAKAKAEAEAKAKKAAVGVLDVVEYSHVDPILGGERRELGVVVGVDEQGIDVVPLATHRVRASADDAKRLTVDDV
jgi:hypothetical protein